MTLGKEKLIPIFAIIVLLIGIFSSIYVYTAQADTYNITINGETYTINQIFFIGEYKTIKTSDEMNFTGIALDDLIIKIGIDCTSCHKYTIIGSDNYEKTVSWENMQNGLITEDGFVAFSDLPKAFRVKNVVKIEVD